ncbi:MAG: PIN domain-containing protein [Actinobacteria bacterium]|nr:PIN domain-containing protein [Actinomycetota bacterium]
MEVKYLLDTSAVITYFSGEDGSENVKNLFSKSKKGEIEVLLPYIALIEFYYVNFKRIGEDCANQRYVYLKSLPVSIIDEISEPYLIQSARLKAQYSISLADALIASYALLEDAVLVHKDKEYLALEKEIKLMTLPLK